MTESPSPTRLAFCAFALPLLVYMVLQTVEPSPHPPATTAEGWATAKVFQLPAAYYPLVYTVKVLVTTVVVAVFWSVYRQWKVRISPLALGVGIVGAVLWIGCSSHLEQSLVDWLGVDHPTVGWLGLTPRPAYNPLVALGDRLPLAYAFLAVRFFGLVLLVPVIEEAFLRAFLMRFVMDNDWATIPFGKVNRLAIAVGILFPVLTHPEKLAALLWFSLVTWLMVRTKNFWDCVAAHAVTNLLLGIYVVTAGAWELW